MASVTVGAADSDSELPSVPAATVRRGVETLEFPDYIKAACGLALGLGLTSGPLFPDVITSLQGRLPRWASTLKARYARRITGRRPATRSRLVGWLRLVVASR